MKILELFEDQENTLIRDAMKLVKRDCQPFLRDLGDHLLFRGMRLFGPKAPKDKSFFKKAIRTDRLPTNTNIDDHHEMDEWFKKKFGIKARSNTAFTTGNFRDAKSYGTVYAFFPIGDFKFIWSPTVSDLFVDARGIKSTKDVFPWLDRANYQDTDLQAAIESGNEIMVQCKEYYSVIAHGPADRGEIILSLKNEDY